MRHILYWFTQNRRVLDIEVFNSVHVVTRFPLWVTLFLSILACVAAIYMYHRVKNLENRRRRVLTTLRAVTYILLLLIIAGPEMEITGEARPSGPMPIILDRTESMSIEDVKKRPRLRAAVKVVRALHDEESKGLGLVQVPYIYGYDVLPWNLVDDPEPLAVSEDDAKPPVLLDGDDPDKEDADPADISIEPHGEKTSLNRMFTDGLKAHRGVYSPAILVVGDGAHNAGELVASATSLLEKRSIPVYFIPIGQERPTDIALDHIIGEDIVFVGEKFKHFVSMRQHGFTGRILDAEATFGLDKVLVEPVKPEVEGEMTFAVEHTPTEEGVFELVVKIPPENKEVTDKNNIIQRKVRVIKDRIRVLMVFGSPSWEFRFLKGAFDRDRRVEQRVYLESVDPRVFTTEQTRFIPTLPETEDELFRNFDMIVMSGIDARTLTLKFQTLISRFVSEEGGSLVMISDGLHIPFSFTGTLFEKLLPVRIVDPVGVSSFKQEMFESLATPYVLQIMPEGQGNPMISFDVDPERNKKIWEAFPPLYEVCPTAEMKPSGLALVEAVTPGQEKGLPAIVYQSYGKGMTLYMGFDSTWRWRKEYGDRYFRDFWGKVVQFMGLPHLLGESAQSRIFLDHMEANVGQRVMVTAQIRNQDYSPLIAPSVMVTVKRDNEKELQLDLPAVSGRPGIFRASHYPDAEGTSLFVLPPRLSSAPAELLVSRVSLEHVDPSVDVTLMKSVAQSTDGGVFMETLDPESSDIKHERDEENEENEDEADGVFRTLKIKIFGSKEDADLTKEEIRKKVADIDYEKRQRSLGKRLETLRAEDKDIFDDKAFLREFSEHVLKTISDRRPSVTYVEESPIWDSAGMMILVLITLCTEYFFRKRWFLD